MTEIRKKVLDCLVDKRLRDKVNYGSEEDGGWVSTRDITVYCGFEKNATTVGCLKRLMNDEIVESTEEESIDGKLHHYYRIVPNLYIELSYNFLPKSSWEGDLAVITELNKQDFKAIVY